MQPSYQVLPGPQKNKIILTLTWNALKKTIENQEDK